LRHPTKAAIAYASGERVRNVSTLRKHLAGCDICRDRVSFIQRFIGTLEAEGTKEREREQSGTATQLEREGAQTLSALNKSESQKQKAARALGIRTLMLDRLVRVNIDVKYVGTPPQRKNMQDHVLVTKLESPRGHTKLQSKALTVKERKVASYLADGMALTQIAAHMDIILPAAITLVNSIIEKVHDALETKPITPPSGKVNR